MKPILFISRGCDADQPRFLDANCLGSLNCFMTGSDAPLCPCAVFCPALRRSLICGRLPIGLPCARPVFLTLPRGLRFTVHYRRGRLSTAGRDWTTPAGWRGLPAVLCWERRRGCPGGGERRPWLMGKPAVCLGRGGSGFSAVCP